MGTAHTEAGPWDRALNGLADGHVQHIAMERRVVAGSATKANDLAV